MLITLKIFLHTLFLPPAVLLLAAAAGAVLAGRGSSARARRSGWTLLGAALGALWLLATPVVAVALLRAVERCPPLDPDRPVDAQAIVILGGGVAQPVAPEYGFAPAAYGELLERITYGAFLARRTGLPILVTGEPREAEAMRATLVRLFGITPRWVEGRSRDTFQNAEYSAPLLKAAGARRILLVTSASHAWRAAQEFADAGFDVVPAPTNLAGGAPLSWRAWVPNAATLERSSSALYEMLGDLARRTLVALHLRRQAP